jgi:hypothetical protein
MPLRRKAIKTQIDENLKLIFEEDSKAELPERLLNLLDQLDKIELPPAPEARLPATDDGDSGDASK